MKTIYVVYFETKKPNTFDGLEKVKDILHLIHLGIKLFIFL